MLKKIKAFSLMEILIAVALVGILVAVLSPNLAKALPDKKKALFVKAYTRTEQAVANMRSHPEMYVDRFDPEKIGESGGNNVWLAKGFSNTEKPMGYLGQQHPVSGNGKFAYFFNLELGGELDGSTVRTNDGINYVVSFSGGSSTIDIQVYNKAKNEVETVGQIKVDNDGKVSCGAGKCSEYMSDRFDFKQKNE